MKNGFYVHGNFISFEEFGAGESYRVRALIALGSAACSIWMDTHELSQLKLLQIGDEVTVSCRPYVGRNGQLGYGSGRIEV